jgi:hypothetical protein
MEEINANYNQLMWNVCIINGQFYLMYLLLPRNIYKDTFSVDHDAR